MFTYMVLNNVIAYRAIGTDTGQFPHTRDTKFNNLYIILYQVLNQLDPLFKIFKFPWRYLYNTATNLALVLRQKFFKIASLFVFISLNYGTVTVRNTDMSSLLMQVLLPRDPSTLSIATFDTTFDLLSTWEYLVRQFWARCRASWAPRVRGRTPSHRPRCSQPKKGFDFWIVV